MSEDIGGSPTVGQGHYHVLIDGAYYDYGTDPDRVIVPQLTAGEHTVTVELVNSAHASLPTPVMDTITVTVADDAAGIWIDKTAFAAEINSATVTVPVTVTNFGLAGDAVGGAAVPGEGHYHVYLDGVYQDFSAGESATLYHVAAGDHVVEVRLADNDHTELEGSVDAARFTVAATRPDVTITSPLDGEVVGSTGFFVNSTVENFTYTALDEVGSEPMDGMGHYHVYVDGLYYNYDVADSTMVSGIDVGTHEIMLELVNNDHTSLAAPVWSGPVTVTVE